MNFEYIQNYELKFNVFNFYYELISFFNVTITILLLLLSLILSKLSYVAHRTTKIKADCNIC